MNTSLLVEKLQARGIRLSLDNGQLNYTAENPLPAGIVTTLTVEAPRIVRYLESLTPVAAPAAPSQAARPIRNIPFKFTSQLLLSGQKTQTRRLPKHAANWRVGEVLAARDEHNEVITHLEALAIRRQRLGEITEGEALAEGFTDLAAFRAEWVKYYRRFDEALEVVVLEFRLLPQRAEATPETTETLPRLPRQLLDQLGDDAAIFAKVLELFPPAGVVEWTPKAERKKVVN